jgi:hypothetical protein
MSNPLVEPALSPDAWQKFQAAKSQLAPQPAGQLHAVAAMALFEQPFGFTHQDVDDETQVADYCAQMAAQQEAAGDVGSASTFRLLGGRHRERAAKIAALLPPPQLAPPVTQPPGAA